MDERKEQQLELTALMAMLPGIQMSIQEMNRLQEQTIGRIGELQQALRGESAALDLRVQPESIARRGRKGGRPPGKAASSGWPTDPAARRREMARRMAVARGERPPKRRAKAERKTGRKATVRDFIGEGNPSRQGHPGHEAWKKKVAKARRAAWAAKSPAEQRAHLAKMRAGRASAQALPIIHVEKAS